MPFVLRERMFFYNIESDQHFLAINLFFIHFALTRPSIYQSTDQFLPVAARFEYLLLISEV